MTAYIIRPRAPWLAPGPVFAAGRRAVSALYEGSPAFAAAGFALLALLVPFGLAGFVDERTVNDLNVWVKPSKFALALGVYLLTLALFARFTAPGTTERRWWRAMVATTLAAIGYEMAWIGGSSAAGIASHFNVGTPLMSAAYTAAGVSAVILTSATVFVGMAVGRSRDASSVHTLAPAMRSAIAWGLVLTFPLTVLTAGTLSSMQSHWIGGTPSDAGGLFLLGWSRDGGDLRVSHFFAVHAMQIVPMAAAVLLMARRWTGPAAAAAAGATSGTLERAATGRLIAVLFALFTLATYAQALTGRPFLPAIG